MPVSEGTVTEMSLYGSQNPPFSFFFCEQRFLLIVLEKNQALASTFGKLPKYLHIPPKSLLYLLHQTIHLLLLLIFVSMLQYILGRSNVGGFNCEVEHPD